MPASFEAQAVSFSKIYISQNVVVPDFIISTQLRSVPQYTSSSFTFFFSAGKIYLPSHSIRGRSSARPLKQLIAAWVWEFISPGKTRQSFALIIVLAL